MGQGKVMHQVEPCGEWKDDQSQVKEHDPKLGQTPLNHVKIPVSISRQNFLQGVCPKI